MNSLLKNSLIVLALLATAALGYYLFVLDNSGVVAVGNQRVTEQAELETQEFLQRLNELKDIELSGAIFVDERFRSLQDNSRPISPVSVGRSNPFQSVQN